jgi:asparagine synthase (glutamine-hydrolysing)
MCGIAGWLRTDGSIVPAEAIFAQCEAIAHRGPDDLGIMTDRSFGFGMRRLSILDIEGGHQPMRTEDGRLAIVFNGEIYNHLELREPLRAAGYRFVSHCDTETVLAAFAHWGNDAWAKLEGMFAAAIWDREACELHLARDPLGIKPLYVSKQRGSYAFASELKALRVLPKHSFDIDERAVHDFFSYGHVRRPRSIFKQVGTLEPGHFVTIDRHGEERGQAYWHPAFNPGEGLSVEEWAEQMRAMLVATTARHMQSDVPVAAFLSGGIDSSAVLAAMTRSTDKPVKAFTIGYPGAKMDETSAASEIARHLGCEHIVTPLSVDDVVEALPRIQSCYDEPFASQAAIPSWFMSKAAAEHVKVVLDGSGGDELFAGYKRVRNARDIGRLRGLIAMAKPITAMIDHIPVTSSQNFNYLRQHAQRFAEFSRLSDGYQQFFAATEYSQRRMRRQLYSKDFRARYEGEDSYRQLEREYFPEARCATLSPVEQFMLADLTVNMPARGLTRIDRASMAHSLEVRVPFLSHKMVEWALTVPFDLKLRGRTGKYILKEAIRPWLPPSVFNRPKQGFQMPLASWMRGRLGDVARETWYDSGAAAAGLLDAQAVERLFVEHKRGDANHGRTLYAIAVFGSWWLRARPGVRELPAAAREAAITRAN